MAKNVNIYIYLPQYVTKLVTMNPQFRWNFKIVLQHVISNYIIVTLCTRVRRNMTFLGKWHLLILRILANKTAENIILYLTEHQKNRNKNVFPAPTV